ncbi:MAG: ABC transporter ATP-binding protein, partial [Gammaproteobacteria bacterium]|nr:ABC transporter ATP-binding protein [Gammaproteobacteria bacterium]
MIEISNLTKRFAQHTAVDDLSFQVQPGEVLGFLGPNGAG